MRWFLAFLVAKPPSSCKKILERNPRASSGEYQVWLEGVGATTVFCDMETDGGGWTVLWASSGADGDQPFVSDTAVLPDSANPMNNEAYNQPREVKAALSSVRGDTLVRRSGTAWLVVDHVPLDAGLTSGPPTTKLWPVDIRAPTGTGSTTGRGWMGYSTDGVSGGGDFAVSTSTIVRGGVDASADLVTASCAGHLVYSLSTAALDGDGRYGSATSMGLWGVASSCDGTESGGMGVSIAVRESDRGTLARTSARAGAVPATTHHHVVPVSVPQLSLRRVAMCELVIPAPHQRITCCTRTRSTTT